MIGRSDSFRRARATSRPVEAGKPEIEHHEVGTAPASRFQRADAVAGEDHVEAGEPQVIARDLGDLRLVVDDQDGLHGSVEVGGAPSPASRA